MFKVPVDGECITPDFFAEKTMKEIAKLKILEGNRKRNLGELFKIENEKGRSGSSEQLGIRICGDVSKVRKIGAKMSMGMIIVDGNVGMHLGEEMMGGNIIVTGNADSWTGSRMKNGTVEIKGHAGDYIGAAYRGSDRGMSGGTIVVHGNAGNEVGCFMRNGLIEIHRNVKHFVGIHMRKGTILVHGDSEGRAGASMLEGKIVVCGHIPSILPTFTIDSIRTDVRINKEKLMGPFYRFSGDLAEKGNGRLFVSQAQNPHLESYKQYLG